MALSLVGSLQDYYNHLLRGGAFQSEPLFAGAQIAGAAAMSFMHGAQDGQKFIGVLFLGMAFSTDKIPYKA